MASDLSARYLNPPTQAGILFAAALVIMGLGWLINFAGIMSVERLFPWSIATAFSLLFAIFNSLLSLAANNAARYYGASVYAYIGLGLFNGLAAWGISGVALRDAESYGWIYVVVTFGFLVFMSMVNFIKRIVNFAEREEWNQPRRRR
jgi:hypothetical protein